MKVDSFVWFIHFSHRFHPVPSWFLHPWSVPLQTEHFVSLYWGDSSSAAAAEAASWRHSDSGRSFTERQYRLDRPQFKSLYTLLVPWPGSSEQHADTLANRTFTLLDQEQHNLVTFREFAGWISEWDTYR